MSKKMLSPAAIRKALPGAYVEHNPVAVVGPEKEKMEAELAVLKANRVHPPRGKGADLTEYHAWCKQKSFLARRVAPRYRIMETVMAGFCCLELGKGDTLEAAWLDALAEHARIEKAKAQRAAARGLIAKR